MARLQAVKADLEVGQDTALGRTLARWPPLRSYGFAQAFTGLERAQLAVLHLFRDTVDADALRYLGQEDLDDALI